MEIISDDNKEIVNPFAGYLDNLKKHIPKVNPVHEIVDCYFKINKINSMPSDFYQGRYAYGKMAKEAKLLYKVLDNNLDDCIWALDKMKYLADKGGFDWSISTCLKHKKL